jgi:hypothetical protein
MLTKMKGMFALLVLICFVVKMHLIIFCATVRETSISRTQNLRGKKNNITINCMHILSIFFLGWQQDC